MTSLFLSYARGDDEPFVKRLHDDLVARGFDVWFDRDDLHSRGVTFHQEIRDAIAARDRLMLIVGPKAVESEYVRQEWQYAWFDAEKVVTPILRRDGITADRRRVDGYSLIPIELKLLHCEDFRDDAQYQFHLNNIVASLWEPAPPLGKLIGVPTLPAHFLTRADRLIPLRDAVRSGLDSPAPLGGTVVRQEFHGIASSSRYVGLHGMGGIGKSVLANLLARDRWVRQAFSDGIVWVGLGSLPDIGDLMRKVHRELGGDGAFPDDLGKTKLQELLVDKAVLLILDDAWRRQDVDAFNVLGPRCRALVTTRDAGLLTSLGGTHHLVELLTDAEALRLLAAAVGKEVSDLPATAQDVLKECGRLPLAVALVGGLVVAGMPWATLLKAFQRHKLEFFRNQHSVESQQESLLKSIEISVLALPLPSQARLVELAIFPEDEAVSEAAVATLWGHTGSLDDLDTQQLLIDLKQRSLVRLTRSAESPASSVGRLSLHDLIHDYCACRAESQAGKLVGLHHQLLSAYRAKCSDGWPSCEDDGYYFTHLRDHLLAVGRGFELVDLLENLRWFDAKNAAGVVLDLPRDFAAAMTALPNEDDRRRILKLFDMALQRDIGFIDRHRNDYPQALFQCMWNSGRWHDAPESKDHYEHEPAPVSQEDSTQGATDTTPVSQLLRRWCDTWMTRKHWVRSLRPPPEPLAGAAIRRFDEGKGVDDVALTSDGTAILAASGQRVLLWDIASGQLLRELTGHEGTVTSVDVTPDGRLAASGSWDRTVRLWNVAEGVQLQCWRRHTEVVQAVAFRGDGRCVASASDDGTVVLWDVDSGAVLSHIKLPAGLPVSEITPEESSALAPSDARESASPWHSARQAERWAKIRRIAWLPGKPQLLLAGDDRTVRLWDADGRTELLALENQREIFDMAVAMDGAAVVVADGGLRASKLEKAVWKSVPVQAGSLVTAVAWSRDVGSSRVDLQACKLEYSIVSPK